jgi:hypothetical protein
VKAIKAQTTISANFLLVQEKENLLSPKTNQ